MEHYKQDTLSAKGLWSANAQLFWTEIKTFRECDNNQPDKPIIRIWHAYMHELTQPSLVQIIACRLLGAKQLSEPILEYC